MVTAWGIRDSEVYDSEDRLSYASRELSVANYLESIDEIKAWARDDTSKNFRWKSLIIASAFAFIHWSIPLLFRSLPLEGEMPMLPKPFERMLAQVCGNLALATALAVVVYNLEQSTRAYSKNIHQLLLFRAMWHLPTLDHIAEHKKSVRKTFRWLTAKTDDDGQFDLQMDTPEKEEFIRSFRFVDLMATSENLQAWWAIREYMLLKQTKERLNMEFLLILLILYLGFCLGWV